MHMSLPPDVVDDNIGLSVARSGTNVVDDNIAPQVRRALRSLAMSKAKGRYHHGDLRRAFLDEAATLVEEKGRHALTLREVARRVGVSHAASTNHFADKAALLAELAADGFEELAAELGEKRGRTPEANLREMGRAYVRFALRRPGHFRVMFGQESSSPASGRLATASNQAYDIFERAVVTLMPPARARSSERVWEAAFFAWSVVHGAAMLMLDSTQALSAKRARVRALDGATDADAPVLDFALAAVTDVVSGRAAPRRTKRA
jgi:AcrR family transcriptional regulator